MQKFHLDGQSKSTLTERSFGLMTRTTDLHLPTPDWHSRKKKKSTPRISGKNLTVPLQLCKFCTAGISQAKLPS
jgi:hypothetical protein